MLIDYIENARLLRRNIPSISAKECERWAKQVGDAIESLRRNGLVWGDAKAANVLISEDGNAVLIDFAGGYTRDGYSTHGVGLLQHGS
jgi:serine/threonine protein kinase